MRIKAFVVAVLCMSAALSAQKNSPVVGMPATASAIKKKSDPFVNGPPFTFDQVLRLMRQNAIPVRRRKDAIEHRGIAFTLGSERIEKLKAAGASEEILAVIKSKAESATASATALPASPVVLVTPPPKRPPEGKLAIRCEPGECEIRLNDAPRGSTHSGLIEVAELAAGQWTIGFKKQGYLDREAVVTVEPERTVSISEVLTPNRATQEAFGSELFQKVLRATGTLNETKTPAAVEAVGSVDTWSCEGKSVRWLLWMRNQPERALFQVKAGGGLREVAFTGSQYTTSKRMKAQDALELASDAGLIRDHQLPALLAMLRNPQFKMLANHDAPTAGEEFALIAERGDEKFSIGLSDDLLPLQIQIATATGAGSGSFNYSDYSKNEGAPYPKTMHIKLEGWQHGIDVHFDVVKMNPNLVESDYKLKKKLVIE
jgi:hypothetical protein